MCIYCLHYIRDIYIYICCRWTQIHASNLKLRRDGEAQVQSERGSQHYTVRLGRSGVSAPRQIRGLNALVFIIHLHMLV